jgi:hypothetical protein
LLPTKPGWQAPDPFPPHEGKGKNRMGNPKRRDGKMKCKRCGGIMVFEKFSGSCEEFFGWRCVFCGDIVDQVILENRLGQKR